MALRRLAVASGRRFKSARSCGAPERRAEWQLPPRCLNQGHHQALALHQIAELTSAWGNIAAKITDQSAHPATSRVLDPLQCPVLGLGKAMRRRSRASSKPTKARSCKAKALKAGRRSRSSVA